MQTWIFQGNPDHYDVDGHLATWPIELVWRVTRYASEIKPGDRVFLWRNQGKDRNIAGVIAEAVVTGEVAPRPESQDALPFSRDTAQFDQVRERVPLRLLRVANKKEVLQRDWLEADPIVNDLPNLKMQNATNYRVSPEQAARLVALWNRVGQDWSYEESVAGLWAYKQTYGQPVSKLPEAPVSTVASLIGRPIPGVYNKVMNFRSLDPRDTRDGLSGSSAVDKRVWARFYDAPTSTFDADGVENEFLRLWSRPELGNAAPITSTRLSEVVEATARRLEDYSLETLLAKYHTDRLHRETRPPTASVTTRLFDRDPLVVAIARKRAQHRCEIPGCAHPTFQSLDGLPYCEVHHIEPLSGGGKDIIENVAGICPSHHREAHLGQQREALAQQLLTVRARDAVATTAPP
jgi:hypothetical protein